MAVKPTIFELQQSFFYIFLRQHKISDSMVVISWLKKGGPLLRNTAQKIRAEKFDLFKFLLCFAQDFFLHLAQPSLHRKFAGICMGLIWFGWFDILAKSPGLYLVPELRYPWFGWFGKVWFGLMSSQKTQVSICLVPGLRY